MTTRKPEKCHTQGLEFEGQPSTPSREDALEALDRIDLLPIYYDGYDLEADIKTIRQYIEDK